MILKNLRYQRDAGEVLWRDPFSCRLHRRLERECTRRRLTGRTEQFLGPQIYLNSFDYQNIYLSSLGMRNLENNRAL